MRVEGDPARSNNGLYYLFSDHLGSTSITEKLNTDGSLSKFSETRYKAWGEIRYSSGAMPTDFTYTGQRSEMDSIGLMYYGARWYDPYITQFSQPDSIIPDPYNPLDWNRYAYARSNPVRFTDPTGHRVDDGCTNEGCNLTQEIINQNAQNEALWLAKNEALKCQAGNTVHCPASTTEIAGFVVTGLATLGLAPELPVLIDSFGWQLANLCSQSSICWGIVGAGSAQALNESSEVTETIYRNASGTADSLTPRPGIDDVPGGGLSFGMD